jgi:DNA-binding NarL/FixJ family response regulator
MSGPETVQAGSGHAEPIRVVLVDDQELFRAGVAVVIGAQPDLEVVGQAADGRAGLEVIARTRPDVVLMDVRMPRMGGVEATRELFAASGFAGPRPRVVLLTTFEMDQAAADAIRLGASGFLLKDTAPELLCSAIRAVHRGNEVIAGRLVSVLDVGAARPGPPPAARTAIATLTSRERDVFFAAARGLSNAEIARSEFLSESTVKTHVSSVLAKLGVRDRVQLVVFAHENHLLAQDTPADPSTRRSPWA